MRLRIMLFILLSLLVGGCSSDNPNAGLVHGRAWTNPDPLSAATFHGVDVTINGLGECRACHGSDLNGSANIPGCTTCHFTFTGGRVPVGSSWTHGTSPHSSEAPSGPVCNRCHDVYRSYGLAPPACHDCHGSGLNHVTGQPWLDSASPDFHGNSSLTCADCHDQNSWCWQCHFGPAGSKVPPGSTWTHGTPTHTTLGNYGGICNTCHTLTRSYRGEPASCHDCHGSSAHVTGQPWLDKNSAQFHGNSALVCAGCHDLASRCNTCHFGETGSKVPPGEVWTHGTVPHDTLLPYIDVCNQCHTLNRSYGNGPAACHDCHGAAATHVLGRPWLDRNSADFHGSSALVCATCHDLTTKCSQCHFGETGTRTPPGSGWIHGANADHRLQTTYQDVCRQCHALDRTYGYGPIPCHDCHLPWTHPFNWSNPRSNHQSFMESNGKDATTCVGVICHGSTALTGATGFGPSCYQCHGKKWNRP